VIQSVDPNPWFYTPVEDPSELAAFRFSMVSLSVTDTSPEEIEELVGHPVDDVSLYRRALTHRSLIRSGEDETDRSNERLEFLGDALLDLIVGEVLYDRYPKYKEGRLTRIRARLVSEAPLARYARRMDLGAYLRMSENAAAGGGRANPSILADAFEALSAAVYRDQGFAAAYRFVEEHAVEPFDLEALLQQDSNYKSQFLERMQARGCAQPTYRVVEETGPSHDKTFTVEACVEDVAYGTGTASSKQKAEQRAARHALRALDKDSSESVAE